MSSIQAYFDKYGESHRNNTNKLIHWICVPSIFFSLMGLLFLIPFPIERTWIANWATFILATGLIFYMKHSIPIFIGFIIISFLVLVGVFKLYLLVGSDRCIYYFLAIFVFAWIGQFIGHKIEGKKPSFFDDLKYLLIGPAWLLQFIYRKLGIKY
jgi:uncharacterized membrane protein YGL010W